MPIPKKAQQKLSFNLSNRVEGEVVPPGTTHNFSTSSAASLNRTESLPKLANDFYLSPLDTDLNLHTDEADASFFLSNSNNNHAEKGYLDFADELEQDKSFTINPLNNFSLRDDFKEKADAALLPRDGPIEKGQQSKEELLAVELSLNNIEVIDCSLDMSLQL